MKQNNAWSLTGTVISQEPVDGVFKFKLIWKAKDTLKILVQADFLIAIPISHSFGLKFHT